MSLTIPSALLDHRNAPPTPFSDLLDLSDNPDTPGTTYSFQELKPSQTMQPEHPYLVEPILDRPHRLHTDDEMFDSDMDRKDDDLDLLDVSSNVGGVDLEDGSIIMEEDYLDSAPQAYDNDDLMIDEAEENEEDMLFHQQQQRQQSPIPPVSSSTSLDNSESGPNQSQDTLRPQSAQTATGDIPLFSFTRPSDSTNSHNISFAVPEKPPVPDHSLYEDAPTETVEAIEETTTVENQVLEPDTENIAKPTTDAGSRRSMSPIQVTEAAEVAEVAEEAHAAPDNLTEDAPTADSVELDNDFQHNGGWSENTSATLAHEPTLLEDQQAFEDEDEEGDNHVGDVGTEADGRTPAEFVVEEFAQYTLHPIVVEWEKNRLSLFPTPSPVADESDLEFFIQDPQVCEKGINELFLEFRKVLDGSVSQDVELFIEFEGLGLEIGEDNMSCNSISLQYILNLHVQLHRQDGVENPEPLRINLFTRPSFSKQITSLVAAATQGMGFSEAIGSIEISVEDSHMKTEEDHAGSDVHTPNRELDQDDAQHEARGSNEDQKDLEEQSAELEDPLNPDSSLTTPRALENNDEKPTETKDEKVPDSAEAKIEEDDDDDFDLEYGTEENQEAVQDESEAGGVELNTNNAESTPESSSGSETPKPTTGPASNHSEETTASAQIERTTEVHFEEISDEASPRSLQQPEEIEDTDSNVEAGRSPSIYEDEELIEYEEDEETIQQSATADIPVKNVDKHQSPKSNESSHHSPAGGDHLQAADSPHVHGIQKLESPDHESNHGSDHVGEDLEKTNEDNTNENEDVSADPKVPSSIPVFHGDDGPEDEYEYGDDQQQQVYNQQEYDDQAQPFQTEEQEYSEERAGFENNDNLQGSEYFEGDFEYNADYPSDEQNEYLDDVENDLQGDADGYDHYAGDDGGYNEFGGEQEYPAEDENGYPIDYPHEGYDEDAAAYYQHEEFGDVSDIKAAEDHEFGVSIKGDQGHVLLPSDAVDILKSSVVVSQVEEEQLIDYEDDDEELTKVPARDPQAQLLKSPTEQKRMREDELEQNEYDTTGENQAKRVRSE